MFWPSDTRVCGNEEPLVRDGQSDHGERVLDCRHESPTRVGHGNFGGRRRSLEKAKGVVDLESIRGREEVTKHDAKARLEEFADKAGHQHAHKDDEQGSYRKRRAVADSPSLWHRFGKRHSRLACLGRQSRPVQKPATDRPVSQRAGNSRPLAREWPIGARNSSGLWTRFPPLATTYPYRGLKGAVGTRLDQITLLGDASKAEQLDQKVMAHLGALQIGKALDKFIRALDFEVVSVLFGFPLLPPVLPRPCGSWQGTSCLERGLPRDKPVRPQCLTR